MKQTIEISTWTVIKIIAILLALVFIYLVKTVIVMVFLAVIIAAAVDAPIDWLVRHKIRRGFAVAIIYILGLSIFGFLIYLIVPTLAVQLKNLAVNLPEYLGGLQDKLQWLGGKFGVINLQDTLTGLGDRLNAAAGDIFVATINIFGGVVSALITLVISIYLASEEKGIKKFVVSLVSPHRESYAASLVDRILYKLGAWFRGQIILMLTIGVLVFIVLTVLKIKFALTLALLAGLLEIVPIIGPIIAAIPAILIAFLQSPGLAIILAIAYYIVQELEKYIIVPQIMKRAVGLNPITIMVAVLMGAEFYGVIGALLAVPVAAMISIGFSDFMEWRRSHS